MSREQRNRDRYQVLSTQTRIPLDAMRHVDMYLRQLLLRDMNARARRRALVMAEQIGRALLFELRRIVQLPVRREAVRKMNGVLRRAPDYRDTLWLRRVFTNLDRGYGDQNIRRFNYYLMVKYSIS